MTVVTSVPWMPVTRQEHPGDVPDGGTFRTLTPAREGSFSFYNAGLRESGSTEGAGSCPAAFQRPALLISS